MHSGLPNTIEMLPSVIEELRQEGYHFVTVSQLLGMDHSEIGMLPPLPLPAGRQARSGVYPIVSR